MCDRSQIDGLQRPADGSPESGVRHRLDLVMTSLGALGALFLGPDAPSGGDCVLGTSFPRYTPNPIFQTAYQ